MIPINTIICGDTLIEMLKLPNESVDLIFCDPPYWMRTEGELLRTNGNKFEGCDDDWDKFDNLEDYKCFTRKWLTECRRILKKLGLFG